MVPGRASQLPSCNSAEAASPACGAPLSRRAVVAGGVLAGLTASLVGPAEADPPAPASFNRAWLVAHAEALARGTYQAPKGDLPDRLQNIDYDTYRTLRFRRDHALWADQKLGFTAQFFHLGFLYHDPVSIYEVVDGKATLVPYSPDMFDVDGEVLKGIDDPGLGFAGFRLHAPINRPDYYDEVAAFLGASYFRCLGRGQRYGKSARGIAIDTAEPRGEEFPRFSSFWLERPMQTNAHTIIVHALLEGPSITGAYTFTIKVGASTIVDVDAEIFSRNGIGVLGLAPLTSMFYFGENDRGNIDDFRPEVHDSDGLQLWTGAGEWIWRPVTNPSKLRISMMYDNNPRGFGLIQRDRDFADYQDLEARYDLRPSVWVEPKGNWGPGAIKLIEIPTGDETNDNIVVFWAPKDSLGPHSRMSFGYRLHWCDTPPVGPDTAEVVATRAGRAGYAGQKVDRKSRKFVVEFSGGILGNLNAADAVEAVVSVAKGSAKPAVVEPMPQGGSWRAVFDVTAEGADPVELRCFLRIGDTALTETWSYQWTA